MNENAFAMSATGNSELSALQSCGVAPLSEASPDALFQKPSLKTASFTAENFIENSAEQIAQQAIRIEAEDLVLNNYKIKQLSQKLEASENGIIALKQNRRSRDNRAGTASGVFNGPEGLYDVVVGYYDESDGTSEASVTVNGETSAFQFDQLLGDDWVSPDNAATKVTHQAVSLKSGDTFQLKGNRDRKEFARFDYIEFVPIDDPMNPDGPTPPNPSAPNTSPPDATRSPLYTDRNKLPNGENDYAFVSNSEQVAYVSDDTSSMIHFLPGAPKPIFTKNPETGKDEKTGQTPTPELRLYLPEGIEIQSAIRDIAVEEGESEPVTINGEQFTNSWRVIPGAKASKFILNWKADPGQNWSEGDKLKGYFQGVSGGESQDFQALNIEVVDVPETEPFETIPVWMSLPSDLITSWPSETLENGETSPNTEAFSRIGINEMDVWSYFWEGGLVKDENGNPTSNPALTSGKELEKTRTKLEASGIDPIPWAGDIWWRKAAAEESGSRSVNENGEPMDIDGEVASNVDKPKYSLRLTYNDDNGGEGGNYFQAWIKQGKALIDRGLYLHSFDPEMYRNGESIGYDEKTIAAFKTYYEDKLTEGTVTEAYIDPKELKQSPGTSTEVKETWEEFKAYRYTKFFSDYREAMEEHMDSKGINRDETPFEMKALTTYHRQWEGFTGFEDDYTESPVYKRTLEDPKMLAEVFDYISPMTYTGIYANGAGSTVENGDYNMKQTYEDTFSVDQLVQGSSRDTEVTPILSAGYPYIKNFEADVSAEVLKQNILESIIAGAYGFGIWGETPIDAKDMKMISEAVSMLKPYEDILLTGKTTDDASAEENNAFVHRLDGGDNGSLVLISDYSDKTKPVTVNVKADSSDVVIDLDTNTEVSQISNSNSTIKFKSTLSETEGRVKVFYIGPAQTGA